MVSSKWWYRNWWSIDPYSKSCWRFIWPWVWCECTKRYEYGIPHRIRWSLWSRFRANCCLSTLKGHLFWFRFQVPPSTPRNSWSPFLLLPWRGRSWWPLSRSHGDAWAMLLLGPAKKYYSLINSLTYQILYRSFSSSEFISFWVGIEVQMKLKDWLLVVRILNILCALFIIGFEIWFTIDLIESHNNFSVKIVRIFMPIFMVYTVP